MWVPYHAQRSTPWRHLPVGGSSAPEACRQMMGHGRLTGWYHPDWSGKKQGALGMLDSSYSDVTWALWHLTSLATQLWVQPFVWAYIIKTLKKKRSSAFWALCEGDPPTSVPTMGRKICNNNNYDNNNNNKNDNGDNNNNNDDNNKTIIMMMMITIMIIIII